MTQPRLGQPRESCRRERFTKSSCLRSNADFASQGGMRTPKQKTHPNGVSGMPAFPAPETAYLQQLTLTHRARARRALRWRPKFLSALSASCSFTFAARAANVAYNTFRLHQRNDPEFARQVAEAEEEAFDLLHARCFKAVVEGELEPVYFQDKIAGHTRKFDSRLAIELLRAHMPDKFKTPGSHTAAKANAPGASGLVVTPEVQAELMAMRQESLRAIEEKKAKAVEVGNLAPNGAKLDGTPALPPVPPVT
jgi:hypothetical protein